MTSSPRHRLFYGWYIVASGAAVQLLQTSLVTFSFGAYLVVLRETFGWSKTAIAGAASMQQIEGALLGPLQGWIIDRFGARGMMRAGIGLLGAGLILLGLISSLVGFYTAFVLIALGITLSGFFPASVIIINWFERRRARALAALQIGLALGGVVAPAVAWSMQHYGWRATAIGSGLLVLALGFPAISLVRNRPEEIGETVDGEPRPQAGARAEAGGAAPEFTLAQAVRTRAFWLVSIGHGLALMSVAAVNVHAIVHMKESLGYSVSAAAAVMSMMIVFYGAGIAGGWLWGDRFDKRMVCAACMLLHMAGVLLLAYASSFAMLFAFALAQGVAWGWRGPLMNAIRADYFGRRAIGKIIGLSAIITVIGHAAGPLVAGAFADLLGNYRAGFTVIGMMSGIGTLCFLFARPPRARG